MFGYWKAFPENSKAGWGARAILSGGKIDLVHDRQSCKGEPALIKKLVYLLNEDKGMDLVRDKVKQLSQKCMIRGDKEEEFILLETNELKVIGNTNGSCGYLYLLAYLK